MDDCVFSGTRPQIVESDDEDDDGHHNQAASTTNSINKSTTNRGTVRGYVVVLCMILFILINNECD
jgi:hypothetical protein